MVIGIASAGAGAIMKIEVRCASAFETIFEVRLCVRHTVKGTDHLAHSWGGLGRFLGSQ